MVSTKVETKLTNSLGYSIGRILYERNRTNVPLLVSGENYTVPGKLQKRSCIWVYLNPNPNPDLVVTNEFPRQIEDGNRAV